MKRKTIIMRAGMTLRQIMKEFGVSRTTAYMSRREWKEEELAAGGIEGLKGARPREVEKRDHDAITKLRLKQIINASTELIKTKLEASSAAQLSIILGTAIDKLRLMEDKSTENIALLGNMTVDEIKKEILSGNKDG